MLLNEKHNAFHTGRDEYPKTLTSAYDLVINWKGYTKRVGVTQNDSVYFTAESEEVDIHTTDGVKMTRIGKTMIFHICGKNHYASRCPDMEDVTPGKKSDKAQDTPRKETPPTKASVNLTIGNTGGTTPTMGAWCSAK